MTGGTIHPTYPAEMADGELIWYGHCGPTTHIGDEVAHKAEPQPIGTVTAIYLESVELSTGDQVPVADLVLLRRAEQ